MTKTSLEQTKLSDVVHVGSRFGRSVNLERDFHESVSLDGYVLTTTARETLYRLAHAATETVSARAWTLTGPYGSGKSAFALFAAKFLNYDISGDTLMARDAIKQSE